MLRSYIGLFSIYEIGFWSVYSQLWWIGRVPCVAFRTRTLSDRGNARTGGMFFLLLSCEKLFGALVRVESPATFSGVTRKREGALSYAALELCARGLIFRSVAIALGLQHELFRRTHWEHIDYSHLSEM